ncbi:MAG: hypothetical protein ACR2RE_27765, partial [Geminicoccaceae bacterium]
MSLASSLGSAASGAIAEYVLGRQASEDEVQKLIAAAEGVLDAESVQAMEADARELDAAREQGARINLLERISARVSRALLLAKVAGVADPVEEKSRSWISANITAASAHAGRVQAIWRAVGGFGSEQDKN